MRGVGQLSSRLLRGAKLMDERFAIVAPALGLLQRRQLLRLAQKAAGPALLWSPPLVVGHSRKATKGFNEAQRALEDAPCGTRTRPTGLKVRRSTR